MSEYQKIVGFLLVGGDYAKVCKISNRSTVTVCVLGKTERSTRPAPEGRHATFGYCICKCRSITKFPKVTPQNYIVSKYTNNVPHHRLNVWADSSGTIGPLIEQLKPCKVLIIEQLKP